MIFLARPVRLRGEHVCQFSEESNRKIRVIIPLTRKSHSWPSVGHFKSHSCLYGEHIDKLQNKSNKNMGQLPSQGSVDRQMNRRQNVEAITQSINPIHPKN